MFLGKIYLIFWQSLPYPSPYQIPGYASVYQYQYKNGKTIFNHIVLSNRFRPLKKVEKKFQSLGRKGGGGGGCPILAFVWLNSSEVWDREEAEERGDVVAARHQPALRRQQTEPSRDWLSKSKWMSIDWGWAPDYEIYFYFLLFELSNLVFKVQSVQLLNDGQMGEWWFLSS